MMQVAIRTDGSSQIGAGHVMRCLSLADGLRAAGATVRFICREEPGHLGGLPSARGFATDLIDVAAAGSPGDAVATTERLRDSVDWLVVDHYQTDRRWDDIGRSAARSICVIDDLADRPRNCDVLINQNGDDLARAYDGLVPSGCQILAGPRFALLRPEFLQARMRLSDRDPSTPIRRVLVSLGGVDGANVTTRVLKALHTAALPMDAAITVLLGPTAPWVDAVRIAAAELPWRASVVVDPQSVAAVLATVDLAIGAAGSSTWERCLLGVPSVMVIVADNQRAPARTVSDAGAAVVVGVEDLEAALVPAVDRLVLDHAWRNRVASAASALVDGLGVNRVVDALMKDGER